MMEVLKNLIFGFFSTLSIYYSLFSFSSSLLARGNMWLTFGISIRSPEVLYSYLQKPNIGNLRRKNKTSFSHVFSTQVS